MRGGGIDFRVLCPYCAYASTVVARDIRGEQFVLSCLDCKETYVVEVAVTASNHVRALADVDVDEVLERLGRKRPEQDPPPAAPARNAKSTGVAMVRKTRQVEGTRY